MKGLNLGVKSIFLCKLASDYLSFSSRADKIPQKLEYTFTKTASNKQDTSDIVARKSAIDCINKSKLKKFAHDTRKMDATEQIIPRRNLQNWHRSEAFIDEADARKINIYARLQNILFELKKDYGKDPEWMDSYTRQLQDNINRIMSIGKEDFEVFKPQFNYLEQLLQARYRLDLVDIEKFSDLELKNKLLLKDEGLLKRGNILKNNIKQINGTPEIKQSIEGGNKKITITIDIK